ncbi:MAG: cell division protein ZapA [Hyphomicrobiales bacterium]
MGQVVVTIAGKSYRLACEDGDEARLSALAQTFDTTVDELRSSFGEVGDTRLAVMAGLVMTDRLGEATTKVDQMVAQVSELQAALSLVQTSNMGADGQIRQKVETLADRLERMVQAGVERPGGTSESQ